MARAHYADQLPAWSALGGPQPAPPAGDRQSNVGFAPRAYFRVSLPSLAIRCHSGHLRVCLEAGEMVVASVRLLSCTSCCAAAQVLLGKRVYVCDPVCNVRLQFATTQEIATRNGVVEQVVPHRHSQAAPRPLPTRPRISPPIPPALDNGGPSRHLSTLPHHRFDRCQGLPKETDPKARPAQQFFRPCLGLAGPLRLFLTL